ncbi:RBM33 protein, partial [Polypterus senegalus]
MTRGTNQRLSLLPSSFEDSLASHSEGVVVSLNATTGLVSSFDYGKSDNEQVLEDSSYEQEGNDNLTVENYEGGEDLEGEESYSQDVYAEHYEIDDADLEENQLGYLAEQAEEEIYNDEVLDIEINDPLDDEFQGEKEAEQDYQGKDESDEEDEDDGESERLRFKTERKDATVIRLSDAATKRRNIPETLDQRFPGQHIYDQNPPSLMSNNHTTPGPAPMAFNQPGPGFHQQGQPSIFQREGPIRSNLHPSGPMGLPHFSQPGMATPRPFIPHRQQFPQGPSQPFPPPHLQLGMQVRHRGPMQPPNPLPPSPHSQPQHHEPQNSPHHPPHSHSQQQPLHLQHQLHHHHSNQPGPLRARLLNMQPPFRPQLQNIQQQKPPRMQRPIQRTGTIRPRLSAPPQNVNKLQNQQVQAMPQRNSNLRELPEAPANVNLNSSRPIPTPAVLEKPVTRLMQNARAESSKALLVSNSLPGSVAQSEPVVAARCVEHKVEKETPSSQPDPPPKAEEAGPETVLEANPVMQSPRFQQFQQQRQQSGRKVTLGKTAFQQQLMPSRPQNFIQGVRNNSGNQSQIRAITQGRGRAVSGQMGRGRLMPNKQSPQVAEPQPCIVSIEGLSSSTTDVQLKNLLMSVGPIQVSGCFPGKAGDIASDREA